MKKFILCACCVFLSGAGAQAVSIINSGVVNASAIVSFKATQVELGPNGGKSSNLPIVIYGVEWRETTTGKSLAICEPIPLEGYKLTSGTKFILLDVPHNVPKKCQIIPG